MYIKESIKTKRLQELEDPAFEVLWSYIRPPRLPRGINCVVTACVYHSPSSNDTGILEYLSDAITRAEGLFPGYGIIIAGDFNQLDTKHLCRDFHLKQLVHQPIRGANILDLVLTNMHNFYDSKPAVLLPPFGLSDYNAVAVWPKTRVSTSTPSKKIVFRPSRKMELGRYLSEFGWQLSESETSCDEKCKFLCSAIMTAYNFLLPEKRVKIHRNDPLWIPEELKLLITLHQRAFSSGNNFMFKFYRNKVNIMRKSCRGKYFASKVIQVKQTKPKTWWSEVKRLSGMTSAPNELNQLHFDNTQDRHLKTLQI